MKKQLFSIIVLGMSLLPLGASAQRANHGERHHQNKECPATPNKDCCASGAEACAADGPSADCCGKDFEGITLTQDQKDKLKALKKDTETQRKTKSKASKEAMRSRADSSRRAERRAYMNSVKEILTPEQYTKFLENVAANQPSRPMSKDMRRMDRGRRHDARPAQRISKDQKAVNSDAVVVSGSAKKAEKAKKAQ